MALEPGPGRRVVRTWLLLAALLACAPEEPGALETIDVDVLGQRELLELIAAHPDPRVKRMAAGVIATRLDPDTLVGHAAERLLGPGVTAR